MAAQISAKPTGINSRTPSPRVSMLKDPRHNFLRLPTAGEKISTVPRDMASQHPRPPRPPSASARGGTGGCFKREATQEVHNRSDSAERDSRKAMLILQDAAVRCVQSWVRVWRLRAAYKTERKEKLSSLRMLVNWKKSLLSEKNNLWAHLNVNFSKTGVVSKYVASEGEESERLLSAMAEREVAQAAVEEARAAAQLDLILQEEAVAEKEVAEAMQAEERLTKESEEALEWRARAHAVQVDMEQYEAALEEKAKREWGVTDHEKQLLKNKRTLLDKTKGRAGREWWVPALRPCQH